MKAIVFLLAALVSLSTAVTVAKVSTAIPGTYRKLSVAGDPNLLTPYGLAVTGVQLKVNATSSSAAIDAAAVAFVNPSSPSSSGNVGFYFGFLTAALNYDVTAKVGSIQGALAEVAAAFTDIFIWFEQNGQDGFQAGLGQNFWNCTSAAVGNYDCQKPAYQIALKDLIWTSIQVAHYACPNDPAYDSNCTVYTFTTSGGTLLNSNVIQFVLKLASQPVLVDNVLVTPNYAKIDIEINYPWAEKGVTETNAHVGLSLAAIGKAVAGSVTAAKINNQDGFTFTGTGIRTYFAWDSTATVDNQGSTVYFQGISGQTITSYDCTANKCSLEEAIGVGIYSAAVQIYEGFGWDTQFIFFSWKESNPKNVVWDPVGGGDPPGSSSLASAHGASFAFALGSVLLLLWNQLIRQ